MCLIVKRIRHLNGKAKIAKRDIPCLKILLFSPSEKKLTTPYQRTPITELEVKDGLYADQFVYQTKFRNIENGIHSYKKKYPFFGSTARMYPKGAYTIAVNAYIPKGTKYWIGEGGQYVSECIKFN
jgi:hypothetical protein